MSLWGRQQQALARKRARLTVWDAFVDTGEVDYLLDWSDDCLHDANVYPWDLDEVDEPMPF